VDPFEKRVFSAIHKSKIMPRNDGPFEPLERVNNNADKVNLPGEYGILGTFNVPNLSPYLEDDHVTNLRVNSL